MAKSPDDIKGAQFCRMLLLGEPKSGKTTMAVGTTPGPVRVILCESDHALIPAKRVTRNFTYDVVTDHDSMTSAILSAKRAVKAGEVESVVLDPLSTYGVNLLDIAMEAHKQDGRRAYPMVERQVCQIIDQLLAIPAHVIVISHFIAKEGDEASKVGEGMLPLLPGQKLQKLVPSKFNDVVWFHHDAKRGTRVLKINPKGVFGPSGRSFREARELEGDVYSDAKYVGIAAFIRQMKKERKRIAAEDEAEDVVNRKRAKDVLDKEPE
jgi:AAA domain-containing protein